MEKGTDKNGRVVWILKALLISYIITAVFLLILALLLYKLELNEQKVTMGIHARNHVLFSAFRNFFGGRSEFEPQRNESCDNDGTLCRWRNAGRNGFLKKHFKK